MGDQTITVKVEGAAGVEIGGGGGGGGGAATPAAAGIRGLPLMLGRMGRIINETAKGGTGGGVKLTAMLGGILFIGNVLTKALKPIFKMMDVLSTILGAALMPIAMIFFNLLRPLLYILLPLVRFMWNIWRPIQRKMAENIAAALKAKPGMSGAEKATMMETEALKAGGAFFFEAIKQSLVEIGKTVTGGALGENELGNAVAGLFAVVAGKFLLNSLLAAAGTTMAALSATVGGAISGIFTGLAAKLGLTSVLTAAGSSLTALSAVIGTALVALAGAVAAFFIAKEILKSLGADEIIQNIGALIAGVAALIILCAPELLVPVIIASALAFLFAAIADVIRKSAPEGEYDNPAFPAIKMPNWTDPLGLMRPKPEADFIITRSGNVVQTDPNDVISGTRHGGSGGGANINITVNATTNDPRLLASEVGKVVRSELQRRGIGG